MDLLRERNPQKKKWISIFERSHRWMGKLSLWLGLRVLCKWGERERVSERIVPLGSSWKEGAQTVESAFTVTNRRNKRLNLSRS